MFRTLNLWKPKLKELPEQCKSCPFRTGNDKEFGVIVRALRKLHGFIRTRKFDVTHTRYAIKTDVLQNGDFACHCTVYDKEMKIKPCVEHRQCPGATKYFKTIAGTFK